MIGYHCTTEKKLKRYHETGCILPVVRFWGSERYAREWQTKTGRSVLLKINVRNYHPMPDHKPLGRAFFTFDHIREWEIL